MELKNWLRYIRFKCPDMTQAKISRLLGISNENLNRMINQKLKFSPRIAFSIEKLSGGKVKAEKLLRASWERHITVEEIKIPEEPGNV